MVAVGGKAAAWSGTAAAVVGAAAVAVGLLYLRCLAVEPPSCACCARVLPLLRWRPIETTESRARCCGAGSPASSFPDVGEGLAGATGRTPLIRLPSLSAATGRTILAKCEFANPGGRRASGPLARRRRVAARLACFFIPLSLLTQH